MFHAQHTQNSTDRVVSLLDVSRNTGEVEMYVTAPGGEFSAIVVTYLIYSRGMEIVYEGNDLDKAAEAFSQMRDRLALFDRKHGGSADPDGS